MISANTTNLKRVSTLAVPPPLTVIQDLTALGSTAFNGPVDPALALSKNTARPDTDAGSTCQQIAGKGILKHTRLLARIEKSDVPDFVKLYLISRLTDTVEQKLHMALSSPVSKRVARGESSLRALLSSLISHAKVDSGIKAWLSTKRKEALESPARFHDNLRKYSTLKLSNSASYSAADLYLHLLLQSTDFNLNSAPVEKHSSQLSFPVSKLLEIVDEIGINSRKAIVVPGSGTGTVCLALAYLLPYCVISGVEQDVSLHQAAQATLRVHSQCLSLARIGFSNKNPTSLNYVNVGYILVGDSLTEEQSGKMIAALRRLRALKITPFPRLIVHGTAAKGIAENEDIFKLLKGDVLHTKGCCVFEIRPTALKKRAFSR